MRSRSHFCQRFSRSILLGNRRQRLGVSNASHWTRGLWVWDWRDPTRHVYERSIWKRCLTLAILRTSHPPRYQCRMVCTLPRAGKQVDHTWKDYEDQGFMYLTILTEDLSSQIPSVEVLEKWASDFSVTAPVLSDSEGYRTQLVPTGAYETF